MINLNYTGFCSIINSGNESNHINNKTNKKKDKIDLSFKKNENEHHGLNKINEKNKNEELIEEQVGILAENVSEIFFDTKTYSQILQKNKNNVINEENQSVNELTKDDIMDSENITHTSIKKRKCSLIDYKILCRKNKMSIIDVVENPIIEKELVNVVNKANLKVHWGKENINEFEKENTDNKNNSKQIKSYSNKNNEYIINNLEKENELDVAIDLLKSYYQLKETFIYYISQKRELLSANMFIFKKVINIKLSNDKVIKINIESIIKVEDKSFNSKYIKATKLHNLNLIVIKYEKLSKYYYFPILFKDKFKLCLFLSLLKSYHRINFKEFSEDSVELMSRYSLGVNVKKVSKKGKISYCKIIISDNIIRFISTTKMKGKIFDILEDFISYETCINSSYFNLIDQNKKNKINQKECLVMHFINSSIPLIFSSTPERDNFIMLFLFLRRS